MSSPNKDLLLFFFDELKIYYYKVKSEALKPRILYVDNILNIKNNDITLFTYFKNILQKPKVYFNKAYIIHHSLWNNLP